jgi:SH3-like domain-containing protein
MMVGTANASENLPLVGRETGLPLPRYASLKDDEIYVRAGPGQRYPIKFIFQRDQLPVKITHEFAGWRKVIDARGNEGWVYGVLISGKRTALVTADNVKVRRSDENDARSVAELAKDVIVPIETCGVSYCLVKGEGYEGWVDRTTLWGIDPKESFAK